MLEFGCYVGETKCNLCVPYEAKCSLLFDTKLLESQSIGQSFDAMCGPCEAKCNMLFDTMLDSQSIR
jgi:hypothetical protein